MIASIHSVNHKLLRNAVGLDDDVFDEDGIVADLHFLPGLAFIPAELNGFGLVLL